MGSIQKTYDGNTSATLNTGNYSLTGFVTVGGVTEGATVTQTSGTYNDRNVLLANSVSTTLGTSFTSGLVWGDFTAQSGTNLGNYTLPTSATGAGSIGLRALTVSYTGDNRAYNGSTVATVTTSLTAPNGYVSGDDLTVNRSASFDTKDLGTAKPISVYGVSLSGTDASNYTVSSVGNTTGNVTRQDSVTWVGGASGEWFNPNNWAVTSSCVNLTCSVIGAVPDLNNVKVALVPQSSALSFDDTARTGAANAGTVLLDALTYQGTVSTSNLNLKNGALVVSGNAPFLRFKLLVDTVPW